MPGDACGPWRVARVAGTHGQRLGVRVHFGAKRDRGRPCLHDVACRHTALLSRERHPVRRAHRAVLLGVFLAGATARSVHGQTGTSPDIVAEAGVAAGRSVSAVRAGTPAARAAWFAGAAVISPPFHLGRNWDTSAVARVAREAVLGAARVDGGVAPAYFDAVR